LGNDSVLTLSTTSVGVGGDTSGTVSGVTINAKFCVKSEGTVSGAGFVYANDTTAANGSVIYACRSRGTIASPTAVVSGDRLASLIFAGNDGTDLALAAQINIEADGTVGANDMPGRITFLTTPDGTQAPTEKMRIANDGKLKFNSYGSGTITGTAAYNLGVDASGNVIELPGGVIDGAGTASYVPKWTDANTLGDSQLFDNGTSVGIGTATPAQSLHISSSQTTAYAASSASLIQPDGGANLLIQNTGAAGFTSLRFAALNTSNAIGYLGFTNNTANVGGSFVFGQRTGASSYAEQMRITDLGDVGIGTSSPNVSSYSRALTISSSNSAIELTSATNVVQATLGSNSQGLAVEGIGTAGIRFFTSTSGATTERVRITATGNVGIGTSSPSGILSVVDSYHNTFWRNNNFGSSLLLSADAGSDQRSWQFSSRFQGTGRVDLAVLRSTNGTTYGSSPTGLAYAEVARFTENGLTFNGDTAAANALDDYEEGTFTPTATSGITINTVTKATYTKIGNIVTFQVWLKVDITSASFIIAGLPVTISDRTTCSMSNITSSEVITNQLVAANTIYGYGAATGTNIDLFMGGNYRAA
jgi:hypothetical protein